MTDDRNATAPEMSSERGLEAEAGQSGGRLVLAFAILAAPLAWFVELAVHYTLFAQHCFPGSDRMTELPRGAAWIWPAAILVYLLCLALAAVGGLVSLGLYRRAEGGGAQSSRTGFIGLCGMMLGVGFTATILVNGLALLMVPPCAL